MRFRASGGGGGGRGGGGEQNCKICTIKSGFGSVRYLKCRDPKTHPLHMAIINKKHDIVTKLLETLTSSVNEYGRTDNPPLTIHPMLTAVRTNDPKMVELLLSGGADPLGGISFGTAGICPSLTQRPIAVALFNFINHNNDEEKLKNATRIIDLLNRSTSLNIIEDALYNEPRWRLLGGGIYDTQDIFVVDYGDCISLVCSSECGDQIDYNPHTKFLASCYGSTYEQTKNHWLKTGIKMELSEFFGNK